LDVTQRIQSLEADFGAIAALERDFATPENVGPMRAAEFGLVDPADLDDDAADAHGHVDDLLTAYRREASVL
jgi:hypothetical protein